jgi:hypothetical protein
VSIECSGKRDDQDIDKYTITFNETTMIVRECENDDEAAVKYELGERECSKHITFAGINAESESNAPKPSHPFRWFPEFWELSRKRLRPQARLMGLSLVVGIVAGLGAIVFFTACQTVSHYALDEGAGYRPHAPGGGRGTGPRPPLGGRESSVTVSPQAWK